MRFWQVVISTTVLMVTTNVNAALIGRLAATDGGTDYQAYYDTEADLTWLADANAVVGSDYDTLNPGTGFIAWDQAMNWVTELNVEGVTGWRLPQTVDVGNDGITYTNPYSGVDAGYNFSAHSELSNMYYNVLGNLAFYDSTGNDMQPGWGLTNTGPFSNLMAETYWSSTEYAPDTDFVWYFDMYRGYQNYLSKPNFINAWAVHDGDVGASVVPVPAAVWLFGSGLIGLAGLAKRRNHNS